MTPDKPSIVPTPRPSAMQVVAEMQVTPSRLAVPNGMEAVCHVVPPSCDASAAPCPTETQCEASPQATAVNAGVAAGTRAVVQVWPPSVLREAVPTPAEDRPTATQLEAPGQATDSKALVTPSPNGGRAGAVPGNGEVGVVTEATEVCTPPDPAQADSVPPVAAATPALRINKPHRCQYPRFGEEPSARGWTTGRCRTAECGRVRWFAETERPTTIVLSIESDQVVNAKGRTNSKCA